MAELACKTVVAIDKLAVDDDTASDTCAESDHDKVLHTLGGAIVHLTESGSICVIGKGNRNAVHGLGKELCERNLAIVAPGEVHSVLDGSGIVVCIRSSDTDSTNLTFNASILDDLLEGLCKFSDVRLNNIMIVGTDDSLCKYITVFVNDTAL